MGVFKAVLSILIYFSGPVAAEEIIPDYESLYPIPDCIPPTPTGKQYCPDNIEEVSCDSTCSNQNLCHIAGDASVPRKTTKIERVIITVGESTEVDVYEGCNPLLRSDCKQPKVVTAIPCYSETECKCQQQGNSTICVQQIPTVWVLTKYKPSPSSVCPVTGPGGGPM
jgi:hypothetical protein